MPRPSGESQKIAENTIPGLNRNVPKSTKSKKFVPNDALELKITKINENRGRLTREKEKTRI